MTNINNNENIIKVGTFFSGIGSPEKALQRLKENGYISDFKIEFFSEIDKNAIKSYCAIHNVNPNLNLGDIKNIDGQKLPYCDMWIGGFPCQDISCAGKMQGFKYESKTRSSLGWEMIRLLKEVSIKPKYVIFENVVTITSKIFRDTLNSFKNDLKELGYTLYEDILCATNFGIPQSRRRYFLVAILDSNNNFSFPKFTKKVGLTLKDFLDKDVEEKYYLSGNSYIEINNKRLFHNINKNEIIYEIDIDKYLRGGHCGIDHHSKFRQSRTIFSDLGNAPTLTSRNLADNCKIVVSEE